MVMRARPTASVIQSARVIGDPAVALRDFDNDRYWSGSFTTTFERELPDPLTP
ncbi:MAG TPA: hypothetical protein PK400_05615 [Phycisphaerales bacterium]|nr:hypothetical protein [Phycisphaerales bacterium]HRQ75089.1 hypothetical protein [Phycisphaerales bacterium]